MKIKHLLLGLTLAVAAGVQAETFINLTPTPKQTTVADGSYKLPKGLTVSYPTEVNMPMGNEVEKFITAINRATDLDATTVGDATVIGNIHVDVLDGAAVGAYTISITPGGIKIAAGEPTGLYYAFQSIKKMLPANVMAGVKVEGADYSLPCVEIADEPRFEYRGFMLDCSRHFFPIDDIKRMIEAMSYYKMNKFHWHLTDDQGWRFEMPDYPRLQTVGATAPNCQIVDMWTKTEYWLNKPYGPYFYTQQEMRDLVEFAAERHIDIIPEVEMPGHLSALMAAYPEFSLNPAGGHNVASTGGIYGDVLNLANPAAIKFAEDVIDALADIFPSEIIHIGGDECPEGGWVKIDGNGKVTGGNDECIALYNREGMTHPRQLQSYFTKHLADYAATKGKRLGVWNESITAGGTNEELIKSTGVTVWCWTGAEGAVNKAVQLGLPSIYTPISKSSDTKGSFYINRSQDPNDPPANGYKCDDVKSVYQTVPFTTEALKAKNQHLAYGVQGTFWAERVGYREYLEYLALPRLLAIAEIGWTPQNRKNWESFQKRMSADRELLDLNGYLYSPYWMLEREEPTPQTCPMPQIKPGMTIELKSLAEDFAGATMADNGASALAYAPDSWGKTVWTVEAADYNAQGDTVTLRLRNAFTNRAVSGLTTGSISGMNRGVELGSEACNIKAWRPRPDLNGGLMLAIDGLPLWCVPTDATTAAQTIRAGENRYEGSGVSPQQGAWFEVTEVRPVEVTCVDTEGNTLLVATCGVADGAALPAPGIADFEPVLIEGTTITYRRSANRVNYVGRTANGAYVDVRSVSVPVGQAVEVSAPEVDGFTLVQAGTAEQQPDGSYVVNSIYETDAALGVKYPMNRLNAIEAGKAYLIRDAHADRNAFRAATASKTVNGAKQALNVSPLFTWILEANGAKFKVKNLGSDLYVRTLERSQTAKLGTTGESFTFTYDVDHWNVLGSNGMYWDGLDNLDLVGWNGGTGHPIEIYEFMAAPFYRVNVTYVDNHDKELGTATRFAVSGQRHVLEMPYRKGYLITDVKGDEQLQQVNGDVDVTIVYTKEDELSISDLQAPDAPAKIYDLQGRRVVCPARGLYIVNGGKVLLR